MQINCAIIDDEPLSRKGLKEYLADISFLNLVAEFSNPVEAADSISIKEIDLLFLDIEMPRITGVDFLKTLSNPPAVIFTTAYSRYALDGFELNALDYLVKPISFDRFLKACLKAKEYFELRSANKKLPGTPAATDHFFIKADNKLIRIALDKILFIEAVQNYVTIHTSTKKYLSYLTFRSVEEYLPPGKFIKVHKSYIVSAAKIDSIEGNDIRMGTHHIPVSRNLKEEVMSQLLQGKFLRR